MVKEKNVIGSLGEDTACSFLIKRGYKILVRNYRKPWGEIDIVAKAPDSTLVFVEVKTMRSDDVGESLQPEDQMSSSKLKKFRRVCEAFVRVNHQLVEENKGWRMDLVAISMHEGDRYDTRHYENI